MNRERAKELLPIMKAFGDGNDIQYYSPSKDVWIDTERPQFSDGLTFRIKPEPIERWAVEYSDGEVLTEASKDAAEKLLHGFAKGHRLSVSYHAVRILKMREVTDE